MSTGPTPSDLDQSKPGWYLALAAPNTKGPPYAWLDPSRIYLFPEALSACVVQLTDPFKDDPIDLVAGIDAMGFVLGAAVAHHLGVGFLAIRKAGHLCVETDTQSFVDYQKREKTLEIRKNPFPKGTRVLIIDQWIETGGTMGAAAKIVETHGGIVAGIAGICIEESKGALELISRYKYAQCTPPDLQDQVNKQHLESFKLFV